MGNDKIGTGILGLGGRGVYFGGRFFDGNDDCELVGICDIREDKITAAQEVLGWW